MPLSYLIFGKILKLFPILFVFVSYGQVETDVQKLYLYGRVKSIRTMMYNVVEKQGNIEKGKREHWDNELKIFNEKGFIIEYYKYSANNELEYKTLYSYDSNGKITEQNFFNSEGKHIGKSVFKYDEKGYLQGETQFDSKGIIESQKNFTYDKKGRVIEEIHYINEKCYKKSDKTLFKYNKKGQLIEVISSNDTAMLKYDDKGRQIERNLYNEKGALFLSTITIYTNYGQEVVYNRYDNKGNLSDIDIYKYDKRHQLIEYRIGKYLHSYQYSLYDKENNWKQRLSYNNMRNRPNYIMERQIEYY